MTLGEFISAYREDHGLSARAFGSRCNFSAQYVLNLEKGLNNSGKPFTPTLDIFYSVAKAVGLTPTELMRIVDEDINFYFSAPSLSEEETELVGLYRTATDYGKGLAIGDLKNNQKEEAVSFPSAV